MSSESGSAPGLENLRGLRVLITGANGQLGRYLAPAVRSAGAVALRHARQHGDGIDVAADLSDSEQTLAAVKSAGPDVIIHAAACTDVDGIEREPIRGEVGNAVASRNIAQAAKDTGAYLVSVSTDMVFPGDGGAPYAEDAPTRPISAYGRSKLVAEEAVLSTDPSFAVARTAWLYGGSGKHFPRTVLTVLRDRGSMEVVDDEFGSPTFAGDLAVALVALAAARGRGIYHLVNSGRASRFELARAVARRAGIEEDRVQPTTTAAFLAKFPLPAPRPADSTLLNQRAAALGITPRDWESALGDYIPRLAGELGIDPTRAQLGGN